MNAMEWNRNLRRPVVESRALENDLTDKPDRGNNTFAFPEMRSGNIGLCFATLIARYAKSTDPFSGWQSPEQAWGVVQAQLAWSEEMIAQQKMQMIRNLIQLEEHLNALNTNANRANGFYSPWKADSIIDLQKLNGMLAGRG
jgi:membrane dipeptidase